MTETPIKSIGEEVPKSAPSNQEEDAYLTALSTRRSELEATLSSISAERSNLAAQVLSNPNTVAEAHELSAHRPACSQTDIDRALLLANETIKKHIKLLNQYNEIKDVGQGLMGMIAEQKGVRVVEVMPDFGVEEGD